MSTMKSRVTAISITVCGSISPFPGTETRWLEYWVNCSFCCKTKTNFKTRSRWWMFVLIHWLQAIRNIWRRSWKFSEHSLLMCSREAGQSASSAPFRQLILWSQTRSDVRHMCLSSQPNKCFAQWPVYNQTNKINLKPNTWNLLKKRWAKL